MQMQYAVFLRDEYILLSTFCRTSSTYTFCIFYNQPRNIRTTFYILHFAGRINFLSYLYILHSAGQNIFSTSLHCTFFDICPILPVHFAYDIINIYPTFLPDTTGFEEFFIGYIKISPSDSRFACKIGVFFPDFQDFAYAFYIFCKFANSTKYMYIPHFLVVKFSATSAFYIFLLLGLHDHFYILHSAYASPGPMSTFCIYSLQLKKEADLNFHSIQRE